MNRPIIKLSIQPINEFGLSERDMKVFQDIFRQYPEITKVQIFGSRAKGNFKTGSDVDLAVMNEGVDTRTLLNVRGAFEESSLPYKVDLVYPITLKHTELKDHITRIGIIFYERGE
jgi:predicted nucleotidyltransferase